MISGLPPDPAANFDGALSNVRPPWTRKGEIDLEKNKAHIKYKKEESTNLPPARSATAPISTR